MSPGGGPAPGAAAVAGNEVIVPGSVANLGGGFDTLGVAVQLYLRARIVDVRNDGGSRLEVVRSQPPVSGPNALVHGYEAAARRTGRIGPTLFVEADSDIPMAAGLGSSAAATVAGIRLFERVTGPMPDSTMLAAATDVEGHADNAAPALFGGLTSVLQRAADEPLALRWGWPDDLRLIVATPAIGLATAKARAALSESVSRADAIFNLQRVLALVHALQSGNDALIREAVQDRWHQPARSALVPLLPEALVLDAPDVLGAFLSGAGPSIALLARRRCDDIRRLLESMYERAGLGATVRVLKVHASATAAVPASHSSEVPADAAASAHGRSV